jgi:hypothetical protein
MTTVTLSVPKTLSALYFVPVGHREDDLLALARRHLPDAADEPLHDLAIGALDAERAFVEGWPAGDMPLPPYDLLAAMGSTPEQLAVLAAARRNAVVAAIGPPGRPEHEWIARALAGALALATGAPVVDVFTPRLLDARQALNSLPRSGRRPPLARWVMIPHSPGDDGYWITTSGLGRFGLPELQTLAVPDALAPPWCQAMTGIAARLLAVWEERLASRDDHAPAFVELPGELTVRDRDVGRAYDLEPGPGWVGRAEIRLSLDADAPAADAYLTVEAPCGRAGDVGLDHRRYLADACRALCGPIPPPPPAQVACRGCSMHGPWPGGT